MGGRKGKAAAPAKRERNALASAGRQRKRARAHREATPEPPRRRGRDPKRQAAPPVPSSSSDTSSSPSRSSSSQAPRRSPSNSSASPSPPRRPRAVVSPPSSASPPPSGGGLLRTESGLKGGGLQQLSSSVLLAIQELLKSGGTAAAVAAFRGGRTRCVSFESRRGACALCSRRVRRSQRRGPPVRSVGGVPINEFSVHCALATILRDVEPAAGEPVCLLDTDNVWRGAIVAECTSGRTVVRDCAGRMRLLGGVQGRWYYVASGSVGEPRLDGAEIRSPGGVALDAAKLLVDMVSSGAVDEAASKLVARVGRGGGVGNRTARRAVRALSSRMTSDEVAERRSKYRNSAGFDRLDAKAGLALAEKLHCGQKLRPREASAARNMAVKYCKQLLTDVNELAWVWGDSDVEALSDAYDDSEDESEEEEEDEDLAEFVAKDLEDESDEEAAAPAVPPGVRLVNGDGDKVVCNNMYITGATWLNPATMSWMLGCLTSVMPAAELLRRMNSPPDLGELDVQFALAQVRRGLCAKGDVMWVFWPEYRRFYRGVIDVLGGVCVVDYDDGDREALAAEQLRWNYVLKATPGGWVA